MEQINKIQEAERAIAQLATHPKQEYVPLWEAQGRILAKDLMAKMAVPPFPKSAYDGYALRQEDIREASRERPVTLKVTEVIPAGSVAKRPITAGFAARIMTGAMIPEGADAVVKHEDTEFTETEARFFAPAMGSNIVAMGEDVAQGACLLTSGSILGAAEMGALAAQGKDRVCVFRKPRATVISTGSELVPLWHVLEPGMIYNSNYTLISGFLRQYGVVPVDGGIVADDVGLLAAALSDALEQTDLVITTGGVSAGDYDYVERVMKEIGAKLLFHRLPFKPGGAMLAAKKGGKLLLGLSGNPSAAAVGLMRMGLPYLKRLCGRSDWEHQVVDAILESPFPKGSKPMRLLWGKAHIREGRLVFGQAHTQRNGAVSSMLGCDLLGEIPAGSGALPAGAAIKAYIL